MHVNAGAFTLALEQSIRTNFATIDGQVTKLYPDNVNLVRRYFRCVQVRQPSVSCNALHLPRREKVNIRRDAT
jgi:hypothetical protein